MSPDHAILVVDDDSESRQGLAVALAADLPVDIVPCSIEQAVTWLAARRPLAIVGAISADPLRRMALLDRIRNRADLSQTPVLVLSDNPVAPRQATRAIEHLGPSVDARQLAQRLARHIVEIQSDQRAIQYEHGQRAILDVTTRLASATDVRDALPMVSQRVQALTGVDRCSVVLVADSDGVGYVVASSDEPRLRDLPIELAKYPELREVLETEEKLVIENAATHPLLTDVRQRSAAATVQSLAVVPIRHDQGAQGVLFLRANRHVVFSEVTLEQIAVLANATAMALRNARVVQTLRAETEQIAHARVEAERRVQLFQRYVDFFESAAEGMVVIDRSGRVLFANPRASEITGFSAEQLVGTRFEQLLDTLEQGRARRLLRGFAEGVYPGGVDFAIKTRAGDALVVNVSFSSVLHEDDAVLFTFRDVTRERRTAIELKRTKEFLECVIDSSVDAIVSANLRGTVLLFNRAAARIFGYAAEDVIGKMRVDRLYPPGVARDVMRKIRDPGLSGYGRLEDYRVDMLAADGRTIAVLLSASLVMDNGKPIGSVGIFTDIRDKLRIQAELERAQDELRAREKQAIVAELAGAAAHELNQPLTSVLGYAQLLKQKITPSPEHLAALQIIIDEADRMAEIVRKVGRITKYETKSYVGSAKILDLEKASGETRGDDRSRR